jgi:hypothetical protein
VSSDHGLETFEELEGEFDGDVEAQMAEMENVLKDGQMSYVRHMIAEKQMLQDQANQMVGLIEHLMAMMAQQQAAGGADLSAEEQEQRVQMAKVLMAVKAQGQEMGTFAEEAENLAQEGTYRLATTETLNAGEIDSLEDQIGATSTSIAGTTGNMRKRLASVRDARRKAVAGEKSYMMKSAISVLGQLELIADVLEQASEKSLKKNQQIDKKVSELSELMQSHTTVSLVQGSDVGLAGLLATADHTADGIGHVQSLAQRYERTSREQKAMYAEAERALVTLKDKMAHSSLLQSADGARLKSRVDHLRARLSKEEERVRQVEETNRALRKKLLAAGRTPLAGRTLTGRGQDDSRRRIH